MNKLLRSLLLQSPRTYELIYQLKNAHFLNLHLKKVHEQDFKAFSLICEARPQLFLDIGANAGMSALSIFTVKPNAQVLSFEPNPLNHIYLQKIANKIEEFSYYKIGLGDREQTLEFYYPIYNGKAMTTLGSFKYEHAKSWLNPETVYFFDPQKLKIATITVEVKTLDSFNLNPEFIKIDVEGFEYQVLLGAQETLKNHRPVLLIEGLAANDDAHNLLQKHGYYIYKFYNHQFHLNDFDCDNNFCVPQEKLSLIQPYIYQSKSPQNLVEAV